MERELYVVYFESANYAGYGEHALVWASSEQEALCDDRLVEYAEEFYRDQDEQQFEEEHAEGFDLDEVAWSSVISAVQLKDSEFEEYVAKQPELYPIVNTK